MTRLCTTAASRVAVQIDNVTDTNSVATIDRHVQSDPESTRWRRIGRGDDDVTWIDATLLPDFWNVQGIADARIRTNGDPPEQLVKVTDRKHRHPVFATMCSIAFLVTIISIIVICAN